MQKSRPKKNWTLSLSAFHRLLAWLDEGKSSNGQNYLEMRERLVAYFDRKNCLQPDDLADETLNRVARRIEEEGTIETDTPAKYCYITARFVFMESLRGVERHSVPLDGISQKEENKVTAKEETDEKEIKEKRLKCLELCTEKLETASRDTIVRYYFGEERVKIENRRALAQDLNISVNALTIRACRIRVKLESCVRKCVG